ncbi:transposase [Salmonella enterica subsp. enterica serovar Corvallis]|nr:transposase [Salmonella enterica subsp. enterica serovar Corvallis]
MNRATLRAVHAAGADAGKNGRKLPLRAAGDFRIPFVINTYKPEDQFFVSRIHKERNIQVCAALNGIVKIIKTQNFCVFFVKKIIFVKRHDIAGKFASLRGGVTFTGFS